MKARNPFAYDRSGSVIVTADGSELLVASASDGAPLWHHPCDDTLVGLGTTEEEVVTLDASGNLVWWNAETGGENDRVQLEGKPQAISVDSDGVAAVLISGTIHLVDPGDDPRTLKLAGARHIAWSRDGSHLAVGTRTGQVVVFDEETFTEIGSVELGTSVEDLCPLAEGTWLVRTTDGLHKVVDDGRAAESLGKALKAAGVEMPNALATSEDGQVIAFLQGPHRISLLTDQWELAATLQVPAREIHGLAFGPRPWLGLGLDSGDVNRVNFRTGTVKRVERHPDLARTNAEDGEGAEWAVEYAEVAEGALRKKKGAVPAFLPPKSEAEIDSPNFRTIGYLSAVALTSVILWGSARFACNAHPPESRKAREVGTVELASKPKSAAVEMFQRLATKDYDGALELVQGPPQKEVERLKLDCEAAKSACEADQERLKTTVLTTAELITANATSAKARVTSRVPGDAPKVYDAELAFSEPIWKVTRFTPGK